MRASLPSRTNLLAALVLVCALPGLAAVAAHPDDVRELARQRFTDSEAELVERALDYADCKRSQPSSAAQPRALDVARALLLDDEHVRAEVAAAAVLIGHPGTLQAISRHVGPGVALRVRELRQPGVLPGGAPASPEQAEANLAALGPDLQRAAVYAHVDALRPGRRPDHALKCIHDARQGLLPALRTQNPALAESLSEDVEHLEQRYTSELSGEVLLGEYRRADGTLDWSQLPAEQKTAFTLDLFLRELVAVVNTGDRQRMEQFFAGLAETDFFETYGAFALGGPNRVANARYLSRYLKPQFVEELMRSNVNLVLGQHVSDVARGEVQAHVFSVSLTSLGLSAATLRAGMTALGFARRVQELKGLQTAKNLARLSRFERLSGWAYVIGETLLLVYFNEWKNAWLQDRQAASRAREGLLDAQRALFRELSSGDALTLEALDHRLHAFRLAWDGYREYLLRPVFLAEQRASDTLASLAEEGKRLDDKRRAVVARLAGFPGLARMIARDHGSLAGYAGVSVRAAERKLEARLSEVVGELLDERRRLLREVYSAPLRKRAYLEGVDDAVWHVGHGARQGAPGDPGRGRSSLTARGARAASRSAFERALARLSQNRLQTYEDEEAVLRVVAEALVQRPQLLGRVGAALSATQRAAELDRTLAQPR